MFKKVILWGLIVVVAVVVLGVAGVMIFFPKEKVKRMAIERISAGLNREVGIDGISISFWGGVGAYLEGISIANPDGFDEGGQDFLTAEALDIKLQFWPLIKRKVAIDRLILIRPQIKMKKLADGSTNYQFGTVDSTTPVTESEQIPDEAKVAVAAVSFDNLTIEGASLEFIDDSSRINIKALDINLQSQLHTTEDQIFMANGDLAINQLSVNYDSLSLPTLKLKIEYSASYDVPRNGLSLNKTTLDVNGITLVIKGEVPNLESMARADFSVSSAEIDIAHILKELPDEYKVLLDGTSIEGKLRFNADIKYDTSTKDTILFKSKLDLSGLVFTSPLLPATAKIQTMAIDLDNNSALVEINNLSMEDNSFNAQVSIRDFDSPIVDGHLKGSINLASFNPFLPSAGNPQLRGQMDIDIKAKGPIDNPAELQIEGDITISKASYTATTLPEPIKSFKMEMTVKKRDIVLKKLSVDFVSSDLFITGKLKNAFPYFLQGTGATSKKPFLTFKMKSSKFNMDKLFPEVVPGQGSDPTKLPPDSLPPIILPDINGQGTAQIDSLIYMQIDFTGIKCDININDRKISARNVSGNVYTGRVSGESVIDLSDFEKPGYSGNFAARQIEVNDFLTRFSGFGGHLFGKVNVDGEFSASGWEPDTIMNNLSMAGHAEIGEARLVNFDIVKKLADQLKFKTFDEEEISDLNTDYKVADGRVSFSELKFANKLGDWKVSGSAGFDGTIDYKGEVLLTEKTSSDLLAKSGIVAGLAGLMKKQGTARINVPFKVGGTYTKPKFALDLNLKKLMGDKTKDEIKKKAEGLLKSLFR